MREVTVIPRKPRVGNTATKIEVKKLRLAVIVGYPQIRKNRLPVMKHRFLIMRNLSAVSRNGNL